MDSSETVFLSLDTESINFDHHLRTVVACDIKAGRCRQLTEFMKILDVGIVGQSFLDLGPRSFTYEN